MYDVEYSENTHRESFIFMYMYTADYFRKNKKDATVELEEEMTN